MTRDLRLYLDDILESIEKIEEYTQNISEEQFSRNTQVQDAVLRRVQIIGEAVPLPSGATRKLSRKVARLGR